MIPTTLPTRDTVLADRRRLEKYLEAAIAQSVTLYLVDRAERRSSLGTVRATASATAAGHKAQGLPTPTRSEGIRVPSTA